jgi:uncharacterized protein YdhG (YjbR/CyaY superfamily)
MANSSEKKLAEDKAAVLDAIAAMPEEDRVMGEKLHKIITKNAPDLMPRTWYGMPAYSNGNKIICFFRSRQKFGERYMLLGFNDAAKLDEGSMWATNFALTELTKSDEAKVTELIKKAIS